MAESLLASLQQAVADNKMAAFAIELKSSPGELVGAAMLKFPEHPDIGEVAYLLARHVWGQGLATEATGTLVKYGFEVCRMKVIHGAFFTRNPASGRVLEKVGMRFEGRLRGRDKKLGKLEDNDHYSILAEEYFDMIESKS